MLDIAVNQVFAAKDVAEKGGRTGKTGRKAMEMISSKPTAKKK